MEEHQTFSRKLHNYTNRTIYNRAVFATGLPFFYHQLIDDKIINTLPKNPEFIIYTLIPDHFPRLFRYRSFVMANEHIQRYKLNKKGELIIDKSKFLPIHSLFTSVVIEEYITNKKSQNFKETLKLANKLITESYKEIKNHFKDTKLVILYFRDISAHGKIEEMYINEVQKAQQNTDIIFIDLNKELPQLSNKEYWLEDGHPSEKSWDLIVPFLSNKLNIK